MQKNIFQRGFTLIELLVVIAIIGILASVVLASLNDARTRGQDAAIQSSINNTRAQAELHYDTNTPRSYASLCGVTQITNAETAVDNAGGTFDCDDDSPNGDFYVISSPLVSDSNDIYCVDNSGFSGIVSSVGAGSCL